MSSIHTETAEAVSKVSGTHPSHRLKKPVLMSSAGECNATFQSRLSRGSGLVVQGTHAWWNKYRVTFRMLLGVTGQSVMQCRCQASVPLSWTVACSPEPSLPGWQTGRRMTSHSCWHYPCQASTWLSLTRVWLQLFKESLPLATGSGEPGYKNHSNRPAHKKRRPSYQSPFPKKRIRLIR